MWQIIDKWDVTQMPVGGSNAKHRASLNAGFGLAIRDRPEQTSAGPTDLLTSRW